MSGFILGALGIAVSLIGFIAGKAASESEKILAEKRRVYEEFLRSFPKPSSVFDDVSDEVLRERNSKIENAFPSLLLYAAPPVVQAAQEYFKAFEKADSILGSETSALQEAYETAAKAHNDLILEMRRDALAWSAFAYRGKSRLQSSELGDH